MPPGPLRGWEELGLEDLDVKTESPIFQAKLRSLDASILGQLAY
jgi:hypothetical protein